MPPVLRTRIPNHCPTTSDPQPLQVCSTPLSGAALSVTPSGVFHTAEWGRPVCSTPLSGAALSVTPSGVFHTAEWGRPVGYPIRCETTIAEWGRSVGYSHQVAHTAEWLVCLVTPSGANTCGSALPLTGLETAGGAREATVGDFELTPEALKPC
ncbi:hypothetical protein CYMTET_32179 [Cymbomonas tetramitiformis]|uniref:Uncharacterized protein n=1 Tax=Cymbomonas tetramitiformis TaxID=36881 RepID=A0AAE0FFM0_9CHLO|nr:hypothetical protein CYMTET_32179 [Cymbomonas tetramitiformis]